jgi:hypothetical protein
LARNEEREVTVGLFRLPIPDYSPEGFREALNNAVLHRDYARHDAVYVQWQPDHLLITSPGGFPAGSGADEGQITVIGAGQWCGPAAGCRRMRTGCPARRPPRRWFLARPRARETGGSWLAAGYPNSRESCDAESIQAETRLERKRLVGEGTLMNGHAFPPPWPIERLIAALEQGNTLAELVAPGRSAGGHDIREHQFERLFGEIAAEVFGPDNVVLRRQIKSVLRLRSAPFPGTSQPDVVVRQDGWVHVCELKSNRYDYDRFDCVFDSRSFREYLAKAGHTGLDPWEVEQDLIKLNLYPALSPRIGSCIFLMVDAYHGSGRSWLRAFRDPVAFRDTMRTALVRGWAERGTRATQIVPLTAPGATANLIVCEVQRWQPGLAPQPEEDNLL